MTDSIHASEAMEARRRKRHQAELRFRAYGLAAVGFALLALVLLLGSIVRDGVGAFWQYEVVLEVDFAPELLGVGPDPVESDLGRGDFGRLVKEAVRKEFPEVKGRRDRRALRKLVSPGAVFELRDLLLADPALLGQTVALRLPLDDQAQLFFKGFISKSVPEDERKLSDTQLGWLEVLQERGQIVSGFNTRFLTGGDSREPELAGIWGAAVGSLLTLAVTLALSFPIGVAAAVYLEEFSSRTRFTDFIEVNINNLAAVPSIVFGLLGLAVFLNFFGMPRSAPLVGGLVLSLMTLPTVIIASRSALAAVPPSIREAALGVGASPLQVVVHHVLPLALPGILTGTIIGMARALGETAPLLMIGMVAFIVDIPGGVTSPSTVLPVQIYLWADSPERAFVEKTSGAILVLLGFLVLMNLAAVLLRNRFESRW